MHIKESKQAGESDETCNGIALRKHVLELWGDNSTKKSNTGDVDSSLVEAVTIDTTASTQTAGKACKRLIGG